ncbi:Sensor histidine kinase, LytS/YehU family [Maribacter sedimenticola]|uniref:Sensor histidine kinase, LytS/YehU family n=1 Tax=Maribacter sedimenticola TaxID=228956 RepID=A0ABY1SFM4_9FLAO|nr:2TM domain-containing protein [Maribacter sedimenticola]SNR42213.1 Sensor histidine kinase, LytS/YehU family [Maribacter sedimenticola]
MGNFLKVLKIGVIITLVIVIINLLFSDWDTITWFGELQFAGITFLYSFVLTFVNAYFNQYISKIYSWEKHTQKRLWYGAIGSILLTILAFALLRCFIEVVLFGNDFSKFLETENLGHYLGILVITLIVSLFLHAFYFYKALQDTKVKEQKIIAGSASAKFDALKNQLDPHFLFNSLNVLTSLIEEDPDQAQKFTTSLSKVYRYVLEQKSKNLISVDEELKFARTYVRLLKMRFEDSIIFEIPEKALNPEAKIVPLSLQLLLENAVKHNIVTSAKPLHIKIYEEGNYLYVSNNLQEKQVVKKSSGVGLQNIRQRYAILTKEEMQIFKSDREFKVRLPMLTTEIAFKETQESFISSKRYEKAKERVEMIKGFYGNLMAYCIVIPVLAYINYRTTSFTWVIFPALGWGFGLVGHGLKAYGYNPFFGKNWEERKIKQYMEDENF